jgi:hypothetical protein
MAIAGYVSVCVQLYCVGSTVFHYMFRPTWPSSGVWDILFLTANNKERASRQTHT